MKQRNQDTREVLVETAGRLFAQRGFDGVSVRDITGAASANLGAVTYHFGSKEALFAAVIQRKMEPLTAILRDVAGTDLAPREKLIAILRRGSTHILHTDPSLKAFFAESLQGGRRLPPQAAGMIRERNRIVAGIIQEGIDAGAFRPCDVECATWVFFGLILPYVLHQPLMSPRHRRGPYSKRFVDHIVDTALDLLFRGLEK